MLLVGLTGNIASGKSTVAQFFSEFGATIIDADFLARRIVEPGTPVLQRIAERWGPDVLTPSGRLNRAELRRIVFADPAQIEELNGMTHPAIAQLRNELVERARRRKDRMVICEIPLLFERRLTDEFDSLVLVDSVRALRLERLMTERGLSDSEALEMIASQMPAELKRARADHVINNDGTLLDLEAQVSSVWSALVRSSATADKGATLPDSGEKSLAGQHFP